MWVLEIYLSNICELIPLCRESFFCAYIKQWPKHIKYFEVFVEWAHTLFLKRKKNLDFQEEKCFGSLCHLAEE